MDESLFSGGDADGESMELEQAFPQGLGAGMTIPFAFEEPTETSHHSHHDPQAGVSLGVQCGVPRSRQLAILREQRRPRRVSPGTRTPR